MTSDNADVTYEELNKQIADLRAERGIQDNKIKDLEARLQSFGGESIEWQLKYQRLLDKSFNSINESNKTIAKLVDKIDGSGDRW
jgi:archaellum component FlaC